VLAPNKAVSYSKNDVVDMLYDSLKATASRGEIRAGAVCQLASILTSDAEEVQTISVAVEHAKVEDPLDVFLPYERKGPGETLTDHPFDNEGFSERLRRIFV
jgi:hypothetical protein